MPCCPTPASTAAATRSLDLRRHPEQDDTENDDQRRRSDEDQKRRRLRFACGTAETAEREQQGRRPEREHDATDGQHSQDELLEFGIHGGNTITVILKSRVARFRGSAVSAGTCLFSTT